MNQSQRYIYPLPLATVPHPQPTHHPSRVSESARLGSLCYSHFPLALCFTHGRVYISVLLFQFIPLSFPSVSTVFSLHLRSYSCPKNNFGMGNTCMPVVDSCWCVAAPMKWSQSCPTLCDPIDCSPLRLLCPWDSPGKNTGVGCHFLQ